MLEQADRDSAPKKAAKGPRDRDRHGLYPVRGAQWRPFQLIYYGDIARFVDPSSFRTSVLETINRAIAAPPGWERHQVLVQALIKAGEFVQALTDLEFDKLGADDLTKTQTVGAKLLLRLAHAVNRSWARGFAGDLSILGDWETLLDQLHASGSVRLKRGEGYAFYCLYPEGYLEAASTSCLSANTVVIGLRSIGTSLASLVAAALGAPPAITLRPTGHPFDRQVVLTPALAAKILNDPSANFAIVDEGPGLSGSSFGCVADWLLTRGVSSSQIHFFPSHGGKLGPKASPAHRSLWDKQPRHLVAFDDSALRIGHHVRHWSADLVGERPQRSQDISGGAWRRRHYSSEVQWPAVHASLERRKYLLEGQEHAWLVKFAGLDDVASQRLRTAAALSEAGFVPRHNGAVYGFEVQEWLSARPLTPADGNDDVIDAIGRYLGFRARNFIAPHEGASLHDLCGMAIYNTKSALGDDQAAQLQRRLGDVSPIARRLRRVDTDNRLHCWEWLIGDGGRIIKTDATDHCASHDLIGCQDIAWDIAGVAVEFGFSDTERSRIAEAVAAQADCEPDSATLRLFEFCYLAFQIGSWTYARMSAAEGEISRINDRLEHYTMRLTLLLDH